MGRKKLSEATKWQIVGAVKAGMNNSEVARTLNVSRKAVINVKRVYGATNDVKSAPISGRPRLTSPRTDRYLERCMMQNRTMTAQEVRDSCPGTSAQRMSPRTVRRRLLDLGFGYRAAPRRQALTDDHAKRRKQWCRGHQAFFDQHLDCVIFSDESNFEIRNRKNRLMIRRRPGEPVKPNLVQPRVQKGGGSVGIWGCISARGAGCCKIYRGRVKAAEYLSIVQNELAASVDLLYQNEPYWFQQDGARVHTAHVVQDYFADSEVRILPWPARSCDLSPIENVWSYIDTRLQRRTGDRSLKTLDDLETALLEEWNNLPAEYCANLVQSVPKRVRKCIDANGWYF